MPIQVISRNELCVCACICLSVIPINILEKFQIYTEYKSPKNMLNDKLNFFLQHDLKSIAKLKSKQLNTQWTDLQYDKSYIVANTYPVFNQWKDRADSFYICGYRQFEQLICIMKSSTQIIFKCSVFMLHVCLCVSTVSDKVDCVR